ncbi:MAG TPA: class I SAM-dependent methyltransferase [Ktedonobacteraceae bacterium]|jgi:ubiquinone/menaquinone biosynthesis C-methylase UbiE
MGLFDWFGKLRPSRQHQATPTVASTFQQSQAQEDPFQWLGERRHVKNAPYVLPSDLQEINRLDFQHYMLRYALQGNYFAPIQEPRTILDVGCGTGRWAMEMAVQFPHTQIIGLDLVPPNLDGAQIPRNLTFMQGNFLEGLPFNTDAFDFVHMRLLLFAMPKNAWMALMHEAVRVTCPGGWIETIETGPQRSCGPAMDTIVDWITLASNTRGVDPLFGPQVGELLSRVGLENTGIKHIHLPIGGFGGHLGKMVQTDVLGVVNGVKQLVVAQNIATVSQYDLALQSMRVEIEQYRGELPFYLAYGQRPLSSRNVF